jgi:uncharacterized protein YeaC (DUF1315 family)
MSGYGRGRGANKRGWWPKNKSWSRNQKEDVYYEDAEWEQQDFYPAQDEPVGNNRHVWINEHQQQQQQHYNQPSNSSFSFHCMYQVPTKQ